MELISAKWLIMLACAAAWTTLFSLFNRPGVRGWRNLGWVACYVTAIVMPFVLPWRVAVVTWVLLGVASGLFYFASGCFSFLRYRSDPETSKPRVASIVNGLVLWPIMALTATVFGALLIVLSGCASTAQQEAAREAWEAHDRLGAARCGGRSIDGVCLHRGP